MASAYGQFYFRQTNETSPQRKVHVAPANKVRVRIAFSLGQNILAEFDAKSYGVDAVKEFVAQHGDHVIHNEMKRKFYTSKNGVIRIPKEAIKLAYNNARETELMDGASLEPERGLYASRREIEFKEGENLWTITDVERCRIYLYQHYTEAEINRLDGGRKYGKSLLYQLIEEKKVAAAEAVLDEVVRYREVNHVHDVYDTVLHLAARMGLGKTCMQILARDDFQNVNMIKYTDLDLNLGYTALDYCILSGLNDVALTLMARTDLISVNNLCPGNRTCLMHAIKMDALEVVYGILKYYNYRTGEKFERLNQRNIESIECNAWQMAKKRASLNRYQTGGKPYVERRDYAKTYEEVVAAIEESPLGWREDELNDFTVLFHEDFETKKPRTLPEHFEDVRKRPEYFEYTDVYDDIFSQVAQQQREMEN